LKGLCKIDVINLKKLVQFSEDKGLLDTGKT